MATQYAVVTGTSSGIGLQIIESLIERDFFVFGGSRTESSFNHPNFLDIELDITDNESMSNFFDRVSEYTQRLDLVINNAGIAMETPFLKITEEEWRSILDVNLTGFFLVSQAVTNRMASRKAGCVVNMSSKNGLDGEIGYAHYNASKAGIVMLTKTMALELADLGIRVNAVCPGYIETPMSKEIDSPEKSPAASPLMSAPS